MCHRRGKTFLTFCNVLFQVRTCCHILQYFVTFAMFLYHVLLASPRESSSGGIAALRRRPRLSRPCLEAGEPFCVNCVCVGARAQARRSGARLSGGTKRATSESPAISIYLSIYLSISLSLSIYIYIKYTISLSIHIYICIYIYIYI